MKVFATLFLFACLFIQSGFAKVGLDDDDTYWVQDGFSCPLQSNPTVGTCSQVCVSSSESCPTQLTCSTGTLCSDGGCYNIACPANLQNVCAGYGIYTKACYMGSYEATSSNCSKTFATEYANMDVADGDDDDYYNDDLVEPDYPGFVFFYVWMGFIYILPFIYFAYNNRFSPVGDVLDFTPEIRAQSYKEKFEDDTNCMQTGYVQHPLGQAVYTLVILTLVGLQIVLLLLTMAYYFILNRADIRRDSPDLSMGWALFNNAPQSLYAFELVWGLAFVWVVLLKRPPSLFAAFLRRSELQTATWVSVFIPNSRGVEVLNEDVNKTKFAATFEKLSTNFDAALAWLFSEPEHKVPGRSTFVPVLSLEDGTRYIDFQLRRYHFDGKTKSFRPAELEVMGTAKDILTKSGGLTSAQVKESNENIGRNVLTISQPSLLNTMFTEFNRIFYVYQNFMTWTWLNYAYWHMGVTNTCVYVLGGVVVSYIKYQSECRLQELSKVVGSVHVLRDGKWALIDMTELMPGDIVSVDAGPVYCDMVLLKGEILVDESSLTGEAMPIVKTAVDPTNTAVYNAIHSHKHNTIFAGTTVNGDRNKKDDYEATALVLKTGSHTMRGELLRDMLFGLPVKFKFDIEVNFVLLILLCYAIFGFAMTIYFLSSDPLYGYFYAIYVVASALPPLLPTVFIVAEGISSDRLLKKRVACSDSHRILMAGKVRVAFFDKTGTLTVQGLDFLSVVVRSEDNTLSPATKIPQGLMAKAMSVCHSVKQIKQSDGKDMLIGNAIDRKMFENSQGYLDRDSSGSEIVVDGTGCKMTIVRQFDFDSRRKTQSVIVKEESSGKIFVFTKGTDEALQKMCIPASLPANFTESSDISAKAGIYQISIAYREADEHVLTLTRDEVESKMNFIGFINFSNNMKTETPGVIKELKEGDIRTVMLSGDHLLTALYVARLSGMIHESARILLGKSVLPSGEIEWFEESTDRPVELPSFDRLVESGSNIELAVTGVVWEHIRTSKLPQERDTLAHFIRVVGRCSPSDKISMVRCFNKQGFITLMCGDGGNDCGALRTAHVGIALSDAEASVVSPFTSLDKSITSVVDVLKEGRCTLASAISSYKYMIMYGQIETINQIICAWFSITFSEWCWVFMDGFWVISIAFTLPFADVAQKLAPRRPTSSILGPHTLASVLGVLLINFLFVVLGLGILFKQDFFQCRKWEEGGIADVFSIGDNYESSTIFVISGAQYITSGMAYNFGFDFRAGWLFNWRFVFFCVAWITIHIVVILYPSTLSCFFRVNCDNDNVVRQATSTSLLPIQNPWNTTLMPINFRHILLIIVIANGAALSLYEYYVVNGPVMQWLRSLYPKENALLGGVGYCGDADGSARMVPVGDENDEDNDEDSNVHSIQMTTPTTPTVYEKVPASE